MSIEQTANMLGALAWLVHDQVEKALREELGKGSSAAAAILTIGRRPKGSIEALRQTLGLTHSATVRLVEGLVRERIVIKLPGKDQRSTSLVLAVKGELRYSRLLKRRRSVLTELVERLPPQASQAMGQALFELLKQLAESGEYAERICRLCEQSACQPCPVRCPEQGRETG